MKKYILILFIAAGGISYSQNKNLNSATALYEDYKKFNDKNSLLQAKEKIDLAAKDETTAGKEKTWFYRGEIYLSLFDLNLKNEMNKSADGDINKKLLGAYQAVSMNELDEALQSFQKETELDEKKIYSDDANLKIKVIANDYSDRAYSSLRNKNYADAVPYYEKSVEMKLKMNVTDTASINNLAVAASHEKEYKKAEKYYEKLIAINYKPETSYLTIIQLYKDAEDTASLRKIILKASDAMPESYLLLIEKINLYLKSGKSEDAIASIHRALEKNPDNHELHLVLGQTYNKVAFPKDAAGNDLPRTANSAGLAKKAEEEFNKAIELKPGYFAGLYSLGVFYNNMGAAIINEAENTKDPKKVKAEEARADSIFQKAIPLLEKAHELDATDKDTMRTLRQLYARTGQGETEKYKKLDAELKGGGK
ncbi:MAG: tetratricopeptide repeat protein [Bacteroidetes bacterium]|nr:tetratricopeptide repeat protein [Bacteroidota bacterium]